jgi:hypothetical protein
MVLATASRPTDKAVRVGAITLPGRASSKQNHPMGDRSPKSNQKQATQKQTKANGVNQKKQAVITAQQATKAKAAAAKKK